MTARDARLERVLRLVLLAMTAAGAGAITGLAAMEHPPLTRRVFSGVASATPLSYLPTDSWPGLVPDLSRKSTRPDSDVTQTVDYDVTFWNLHSREILPYRFEDDPGEASLSGFLRCRVTGDESPMDADVFRWAAEAAVRHERDRVHVVSGFRSSKFNAYRRKHGHEVARSSYHMRGEALDFRIPGVPTRDLVRDLDGVHRGGLGRYPVSGFVHLDSGPNRRWRGR